MLLRCAVQNGRYACKIRNLRPARDVVPQIAGPLNHESGDTDGNPGERRNGAEEWKEAPLG